MIYKEMHPVEKIHLTNPRICIQEQEVQIRISFLDLLLRALGNNMIGDTAKGLQTQDIGNPILYKRRHLTRNEPAFAILMIKTENLLRVSSDIINICMMAKTPIVSHHNIDLIQVVAE